MKYKYLCLLLILLASCSSGKMNDSEPTAVIITAGQSNTDGRIGNDKLPDYILNGYKDNAYQYCKISRGSTTDTVTGNFKPFWPSIKNKNNPHRWAYDAVTYYWLEKAFQKDFYVIKWSLGGTAIDTAATSNSKYYWQADENWLTQNTSTAKGGKSLLLSFEENISLCIDSTLSKLKNGYSIKAFLWHQGESDSKYGSHYYENLKNVIAHMRNFLVQKTGDMKYKQLPFICGTVSRLNKQYNKEVETAMHQLALEDSNFYVIDMSQGELQTDQLHFTETSAEYLGIEMYNKLVELNIAGNRAKKVTLK
ncbi:polysaccharide deacetylase [Flavobacterium sp. Sd200]|uniref:sialate O-acetylesterase n=1 Tax=Flavobacterium sp. Sd200 TaxID=2692211 RepID=UPI00136A48A6|nr:sialate O-acetylesterase [Flavobacterium sp. Sd200]MXN90116.1 polysaccharide deacetylase [Flavobacterium sp. Sd200]